MKYLLLIALLALVFFMLGAKRARPPEVNKTTKPKADPLPPQDMLKCAHCGLHLPQDEALPGRGGVFCSAEHRQAHEAGVQ